MKERDECIEELIDAVNYLLEADIKQETMNKEIKHELEEVKKSIYHEQEEQKKFINNIYDDSLHEKMSKFSDEFSHKLNNLSNLLYISLGATVIAIIIAIVGFFVCDAQIEKSEKKLKNLIEIYTDGQINKDEFLSMRQAYDEELKKLKEQKNSFGKQQEIVENCILDMSGIVKALAQMVDMSNPDISKDLLNEVVTSIVPRDKKYVWNYRIDGNTAKTVDYIADGTKKCPDIHLDDCYSSSEASSDVSDLHIYSLLPTVKASPEKLSLIRNLLKQL